MKKIFYISFVALLLAACANKGDSSPQMFGVDAAAEVSPAYTTQSEQKGDEQVAKSDNSIEPKIIKTGNISIETSDVYKTKELIYKYVRQFSGWISAENFSSYDGRTYYSMSVRVPAKFFDPMLDSISRSGKRVDNKNVYIQDITEEFIDIEARLKTKKELEARYLELLKKATKVEEMLSIEKAIGVLRSDIESIEGRYKYMKSAVDYSTLEISYYEPTKNFGNKLVDAIKTGWNAILWVLVAIVKAWAVILLAVVLVIFIVKIRRCRRAKKSNKQ